MELTRTHDWEMDASRLTWLVFVALVVLGFAATRC
jgi:hypothetical protein